MKTPSGRVAARTARLTIRSRRINMAGHIVHHKYLPSPPTCTDNLTGVSSGVVDYA
jgi:hypothetical protein